MARIKLNNKNGRLFSMSSYDKDPQQEHTQIIKQFGKKYFVYADISDYYPSIYTHSIGWALVGKKLAKTNQKNKVWYNQLDKLCRDVQDGETKGIPIGPDYSAIISELILSQIDKKLEEYSYVRFIDDYSCFCATNEEAENFILELSQGLEEFKLKLNTEKTKILPLPKALNEDWVRKLRQFIEWKEISKSNKNQIIGFLDLASELFRINPNESTIRYAAQVLKRGKYTDYQTFEIVLRYFFNLCFLFPYVTDMCYKFI